MKRSGITALQQSSDVSDLFWLQRPFVASGIANRDHKQLIFSKAQEAGDACVSIGVIGRAARLGLQLRFRRLAICL